MDKSVLKEYIDACEVVKETEWEIKKLSERRRQIVQDSVKGSSHEFPYTAQTYHLEGLAYSGMQRYDDLERKEILLRERLKIANQKKYEVEMWLNTIPCRMQRIIRYKFFENLTWEQVAGKMGRKTTADSIRMEYVNFMKVA